MRRRDLLKGLLALPFLGFLKPLVEAKGDIVHIDFTGEYIPKTKELVGIPINNPPNWAEPGYLVVADQEWQENNNAFFSKEILSKYIENDVRLTRKCQDLQEDLDNLKSYQVPVDYGRRIKELMYKHPGLTFQMIANHTNYSATWLETVYQYSKLTRQAAKLWREGKIGLPNLRILRCIQSNHQFAFLEDAEKLDFFNFYRHVEHYLLLQKSEGVKGILDVSRTVEGVHRRYSTKNGSTRTFYIKSPGEPECTVASF